jgi:hypothetical protein
MSRHLLHNRILHGWALLILCSLLTTVVPSYHVECDTAHHDDVACVCVCCDRPATDMPLPALHSLLPAPPVSFGPPTDEMLMRHDLVASIFEPPRPC